jgi:hypothetical protein
MDTILKLQEVKMGNKDAMKDPWLHEIVPEQRSGQSSFTHSHIECRNPSHVKETYRVAAERLLNVNRWHEYSGNPTAAFQLFDESGNAIYRPVQKGDYFRIDIPGPGNPDTQGGDWVQVIEIGKRSAGERALTFITAKATPSPLVHTSQATHFFDEPATSTFVIYANQLTIMAAVFGRNEHANTRSANLLTRIRNWFVYLGAQLGMANLQWKALTRGLLH